MLGFLMYFPHSAQVTRNAHGNISPAKRRVFCAQDFPKPSEPLTRHADGGPIQGLCTCRGFSRYEAHRMSGPIQSSDYVPGVSGWKFNTLTGEFEIHTSTSSSIPDPQPITVTAGDWSESELPSNALERYAFLGSEIQKIPLDCRESAEISTSDHSCCPGDYSDVRTTITYVRRETLSEVEARMKRGSASTTTASFVFGWEALKHQARLWLPTAKFICERTWSIKAR